VIFRLVLNIFFRRRCLFIFYIAHTILELGWILDQFASVILSIIEFYHCEILQDGLGFPGLERSLAISVLVRNSLWSYIPVVWLFDTRFNLPVIERTLETNARQIQTIFYDDVLILLISECCCVARKNPLRRKESEL